MANKDYIVHINLNKQQLLNAALQNLAVFPSTSVDPVTGAPFPVGYIFWHTGDSTAYCWTGSSWLNLGQLYTHPTFPGTGQPATALAGASVISQIRLNNGHVTGVTTRNLTASDIGAASSSHVHNFTDIVGLPSQTILGNNTGGTGPAQALTVANLLDMLSIAYGSAALLNAGVDTTQRTWTAKQLSDYITARLGAYLTVVNLGYTASPSDGTITNSAGTGATIPAVDNSNAGLMLPAQKTKLDGIENGANNYIHPTDNPGAHPFVTLQTSGLQILSQLVVNNQGHTVGVSARNLTNADIVSIFINDAITSGTFTWSSSKIDAVVQATIAQAQTGALSYKGEYNPNTNTPQITNVATGVKTSWTYVVSVNGTFLGEQVEAGDMIIAKQDNPGTTLANWQLVNKNIPAIVAATTLVQGIVRLATMADYNANDNTTAVTPLLLKAVLDANVGGYYATFGNGSGTSFTVDHGLNTDRIIVQIRRVDNGREVILDWAANNTTSVILNMNIPPQNNEYEIIIKK